MFNYYCAKSDIKTYLHNLTQIDYYKSNMDNKLHFELFNAINEIEPIYQLNYQEYNFWTNQRIGNIKSITFGISDNIEDIKNHIKKKQLEKCEFEYLFYYFK